MYELFKIFSIFDFFSPIFETVRDLDHIITDRRSTYTLFVNEYDEDKATQIISQAYKVVSKTRTSTSNTVGITVPKFGGADGWDSIRTIQELLEMKGIKVGL